MTIMMTQEHKTTAIVVIVVLTVGIFLSSQLYTDEPSVTAIMGTTKNQLLRDPRDEVSPRLDTVASSHVLERDEKGLWYPKLHYLNDSLASVDKWLFESPRPKTVPFDQYLGVVRIPRTGSTSLLHFMKDSRGVHTLHNYLNVRIPADPTKSKIPEVDNPSCFFGAHAIYRKKPDKGQQCHNQLYSKEVTHFAKSLRFLRDDETARPRLRVALDMITMVRDPFERYVSFFHYWRSSSPDLSLLFESESPIDHALIQGDLESFLREIAKKENRQKSPLQYEFLSSNVDKAIALVQQLRVLPLVTECFDASIWLLTDQYPYFFPRQKDTADFLQHSMYKHANERNPKREQLKPGLQQVKAFDKARLQKLAREEWLADDYRFYGACVSVLQSVLQKISTRSNGTVMDSEAVKVCLAKKLG